jgi:hypothetical protein
LHAAQFLPKAPLVLPQPDVDRTISFRCQHSFA